MMSRNCCVNLFQYLATLDPPMTVGSSPFGPLGTVRRNSGTPPPAITRLLMFLASCELIQISFGLSRRLSQKNCSAVSISTIPAAPSDVRKALSSDLKYPAPFLSAWVKKPSNTSELVELSAVMADAVCVPAPAALICTGEPALPLVVVMAVSTALAADVPTNHA